MNLNPLWQKYKSFLTKVIGGFAVFMLLFYFTNDYLSAARDGAESAVHKNDKLGRDVRNMVDYTTTINQKKSLAKRFDAVIDAVSILDHLETDVPEHPKASTFNGSVASIYAEFERRANRVGLKYPPLEDIDFAVGSDMTPTEWQDRYVQLELMRRMLQAAVDLQLHQVESIEPRDIVFEAIPNNDKMVLYRYPLECTVVASYEDLLRLVERFHVAKQFMSIEFENIVGVAGSPGLLRAQLGVYGIHLAEAREDKSRQSGRPGYRRRPRR